MFVNRVAEQRSRRGIVDAGDQNDGGVAKPIAKRGQHSRKQQRIANRRRFENSDTANRCRIRVSSLWRERERRDERRSNDSIERSMQRCNATRHESNGNNSRKHQRETATKLGSAGAMAQYSHGAGCSSRTPGHLAPANNQGPRT